VKKTQLTAISETPVSHNPDIRKKVMLGNRTIPGLTTFAQATLTSGQQTRPHKHADMWEVYLVEAGCGIMRVAGDEHRLGAGTCIAVEPGESHSVENTAEVDLVLTYFGIAPENQPVKHK